LIDGNPDKPDEILMSSEAHFHPHSAINKQYFGTGLPKICMNFSKAPCMTKKLLLGVQHYLL
jgi:hypothetical protein